MSLPQNKNDYIECGIIGIDDDENNNSKHVAHTESNNSSSFIATDDYSTSNSDENERNKSSDVPIVFASEDFSSKSSAVGKKKKEKNSSSNANKNNEEVNPSSVKPKDKEEEKEEEGGGGCNNKEVAVLVLPPSNKNTVNCNINTNNGSSSSIISKSNNAILVSKLNNNEEIVHFPDCILEKERDDYGASNKKVAEQRVLPSNEDDFSNSSTFTSKPYPADTYSFLCLYGPVENPGYFSYGVMVYLFQMTFLVLMVLSVTHPDWSSNGDADNPDGGRGSILARIAVFVPSHVSPLVRATQITATLSYVIFADSTVLDVVTAVELFPRFNQATSDDKLGCMIFASILRLSQGIFAITVTLLLIVTSSTTIEIILNFTAINFISTLDNVGFEIIKWGKYGTQFEEEAKRIEKLPLPRCIYRKYKHVRYLCTIIPVGVILFSMICFMIILQESNSHWVTKIFRVQFRDKEQGLQVYNGCYQKNEDAINRYEGFRRKLYESFGYNSESAKFGYCIDDRRWILFNGNSTNACEARGNDNELARSSKTDTFDVSTMFEEQWYTSSTPLEVYFVEENGDIELNNNTCLSFIGDSNCDSVLNEFDFQYDGGDCCAATCSGFNCGIGSLKNAFGATDNIRSGDGFPNCVNPDMVPITIRLDNILRSFDPFSISIPDGSNISSTINDILTNSVDDDSYTKEMLIKGPIKPLLLIDCDGSNVLSIYVEESMENQTETIMVSDGADCTMTIRNDGSAIRNNGTPSDPIWNADYTILHGDKKSIESNLIVVAQSSSAKESTYDFKRIPECYLDMLSDYIDRSIVYTGIDFDPTAKAVNWLMNDESETSMCEDPFLLERYALAVIYFAAPSNFPDYALISTTRQCVWPSIICDEGTVISLNMNNKSLIGTIPSEIGLLTSLGSLSMFSNALTGTIPSEIGWLTSLENLSLDSNALTGTIPSVMGLLTSLVFLSLDTNKLTGTIPSEIGLLTSFNILSLSYNALTGTIPSEIGLMTSLGTLNLQSNELTGSIPSEIGLLTSLDFLLLGFNALTGTIPSVIGLLTSLNILSMFSNALTGNIPSEIGLLTSLDLLYLAYNALNGTIPIETKLLTSLEELYLSSNELTGFIPSEIGLLTSLEMLSLHSNVLNGSIPSEIGLLTSLNSLNFAINELIGSIPSEIGLLTSLEELYLCYNALTGTIPSEIGLLTSLYDINFEDSNVSNHTLCPF